MEVWIFEDYFYRIVYVWIEILDVQVLFYLLDNIGNFGWFVFDFIFYLYYVNMDCIWNI